jgi:DNA-directed RNA polymerase subunit RPC12/RpoP
MDLIFNCPKCGQELAVDATGAGEEIDCPNCSETIRIPEPNSPLVKTSASPLPEGLADGSQEPNIVSAIAASAAAKVKMNLKVPVTNKPPVKLIAKTSVPLTVAAKESDRKLHVKTIRHIDCVEVGHDRFDEVVTNFLTQLGEQNLISITPVNYSYLELGSQKMLTDYGVVILFKA